MLKNHILVTVLTLSVGCEPAPTNPTQHPDMEMLDDDLDKHIPGREVVL